MLRRAKICEYLLLSILMTGCLFMDHRKSFEEQKHLAVGKRIDQTFYRWPHWTRQMEPGQIGYGFTDPRGCSYIFAVDEATQKILSWRYLSDPKLCWTYMWGTGA
jgi:hypothetical protein